LAALLKYDLRTLLPLFHQFRKSCGGAGFHQHFPDVHGLQVKSSSLCRFGRER
jgi:hypothetical protein